MQPLKTELTQVFMLGDQLFVPHHTILRVFVTYGGYCATEADLLKHGAKRTNIFLWKRDYDSPGALAANSCYARGERIVTRWFSFIGYRPKERHAT